MYYNYIWIAQRRAFLITNRKCFSSQLLYFKPCVFVLLCCISLYAISCSISLILTIAYAYTSFACCKSIIKCKIDSVLFWHFKIGYCYANSRRSSKRRRFCDSHLTNITSVNRAYIQHMKWIKASCFNLPRFVKGRIRQSLQLLRIKHWCFSSFSSRYGELRLPCLHPLLHGRAGSLQGARIIIQTMLHALPTLVFLLGCKTEPNSSLTNPLISFPIQWGWVDLVNIAWTRSLMRICTMNWSYW